MKKNYPLLLLMLIFFGNSFCKQIYAACAPGQAEIIIIIVPDVYDYETTWNIVDASSNILASGTFIGDTICVPINSCVIFNIYDSFGDGIFAPGGYQVLLDGTLVASGSAFGYGASAAIACPAGSYCTSPLPISYGSYTAQFEDSWYVYTADSSGIYELSTCTGNSCNTGLWIYSNCLSTVPTDGPAGAYAFNDDYCGTQSRITCALIAGTTYRIRVGDIGGACNSPINFTFNYLTPIYGCTNTSACNFNPSAEVDDGSCIFYPNPLCSGPDLRVDSMELITSMALQQTVADNCDIQEGCLLQYGTRQVIRFTTKIDNIGTLDYYIGSPNTTPGMFNTNNCHGHAHYEGYGDYRLYDMAGNIIPAGHKNGYCVIDLCGAGQYTCGNMGISTNCFDVYGAGTQCQWIDITDVPTGDYRLAIIINAQHVPDALGHHEINYNNNALQLCIHIQHNGVATPTWNLLPNCTPFVDCAGVSGGAAVVDCNGNCNGNAIAGDRQSDQVLNSNDIQIYLNDIQTSINNTAPCVDVSGNAEESIYDAALINWCRKHTYILYPGGPTQYGCNFPRNIINPSEQTALEITYVDLAGGFLDIAISNPTSDVKAFQFNLSGVIIQNVVSLASPILFPVDIRYNGLTNTIFGISPVDSTLQRTIAPQQLLRVYFSNVTDTAICIGSITDIVNSNAERTTTSIVGNCWPSVVTAIIDKENLVYFHLVPNPAADMVKILIQNPSGKKLNMECFDYTGKLVSNVIIDANKTQVNLSLNEFNAGIYFVKISNDKFYRVQRLVKL